MQALSPEWYYSTQPIVLDVLGFFQTGGFFMLKELLYHSLRLTFCTNGAVLHIFKCVVDTKYVLPLGDIPCFFLYLTNTQTGVDTL